MIVIPMAGLSRRFTEAGYKLPKYMLPLRGASVFAHAVGSFSDLFSTEIFLFIARDNLGTEDFISAQCRSLGIRNVRIKLLPRATAGQAETVELGLFTEAVTNETSVTVFNIDTFRPGFRFPDAPWFSSSEGYLEVFLGEGANWSYVRPFSGTENLVAETAEKRPISDLCCTGLYHFARKDLFVSALARERAYPTASELYVAPLYNHLINDQRRIHYHLVERSDIIFCGIPAEYEALLESNL